MMGSVCRKRFRAKETRARLQRFAFARPRRRPGCGDLGGGQTILCHPQRERALLQQRRAIGSLRNRTHPRRKRDREDCQCDEDLD